MKHIVEVVAPIIIYLLEALGILIIALSAIKAFVQYAKNTFRCTDYNIKLELAKSLAFALEFKLGSEILKTVMIRTFDEIIILGSIIALRAIMTFVIHWEIKCDTHHSGIQSNEKITETLNRKAM
jgi:uncharacterized membrane protein